MYTQLNYAIKKVCWSVAEWLNVAFNYVSGNTAIRYKGKYVKTD